MTPAINLLEKHKIEHSVHRYAHDPSTAAFGLEAVEKLGVDAASVFKTLVISVSGTRADKLATAIVPVTHKLDLKAMARACQMKKAEMADPAVVERTTGYVLGGVSPLGQKRRLTSVLDQSAEALQSIYVSAGKRGLEIELAPAALLQLLDACLAPIASQ